ncbi:MULTISPECIES: serine/threonine-protein kinase [Streptomyces]|uniref:Serine/threonine protein kinase n=1 Tax=Streptomyces dengpaensis TaxID=2049881 RepID=A0ABN5IEQ7_9ACTN|nr:MULTISPECIES: serine/threonine-protein kinase [Streptomyces]AVH61684.1 serine/threonine protein kinase [Streptomyces dengpaensis]PIB02738.1 serine/threonine protein kinase [Streptomyces sp. HG99]
MAKVGSLVQGRYRLLNLIGRGGMGEVWRARDEPLGRHVAVKCLKPLGPVDDQSFTRALRERFRREARVAATLQHRGVTVVHDFGESEGMLYVVTELLEGRNLSQLLADNNHRPLRVHDVVEIAEQVASALSYAHQQGLVHRDLKPANIMRLVGGTVKICDFGIARLGHDIGFTAELTNTVTGFEMGTPHYMSPEQISGAHLDPRSDLYSLGCVLYEIATGAPPFDLDDAWSVLVAHRDTPPDPPRNHRAELPAFLAEIIMDLLAKRPEDRPQSAAVLTQRLRAGQLTPRSAAARATARSGPNNTPDTDRNSAIQTTDSGPPAPQADTPGTSRVRHAPPTPSPELITTLTGRHNAGLSLGRLGRWTEAGEVHRAVAAEREHALGPDHPDTLASRYEVGFTLSRTGHPADALREYTHVAEARERVLGPDHPHTLATRQEMAYVLGQLGRHFEAHQTYTSVLAARERAMGADHPDTLRCRHNLAFNLSRLGRLEDSYQMASEVAAARARVLGPTHPDTLVTRYEVAYALGQLDRWPEALHAHQEVADARAQALGPDHPDTLAARYEVGISLGRLGRSSEALTLYRDLINDRTRVQGPTHPDTLRARHGLGVNLGRMGRWEEALAESRDVCAIRQQILGHDHPDTLVSHREVAVGLGWLGHWEEALTEYRAVADTRERVLGPDHPDTLASRNDEAHCLEQLGRGQEAVELYRRVAFLRQQNPQ